MKNFYLKSVTLILSITIAFWSAGYGQCEYSLSAMDPFDSVTSASLAVPALGDIDGDNDLDVFVGQNSSNVMKYFENIGTASNPIYTERTGVQHPLSHYSNTNGGNAPSLVDIDNDGDLDVFVGIWAYKVKFYENTGTDTNAVYVLRTGTDNPLDSVNMPSSYAYPSFNDMDGDNDYDAIVCDGLGNIYYYQNTGTDTMPVFTRDTANNPLKHINHNSRTKVIFHDVDGDGLNDALVSEDATKELHYYRNEGTANSPDFVEDTASNLFANLTSAPTVFAPQVGDLNGDGVKELVLGQTSSTYIIVYELGGAIHDTINAKACLTYTSPGGNVYSVSGTYQDTTKFFGGCDSILTINLTIDSLDPVTISESGGVLSASLSGVGYQWYLDGSAISGATSKDYTPAASGDYTVKVTKGACSETSTALSFTYVAGILNELDQLDVNLYPNPSSGHIYLDYTVKSKGVLNLRILNQTGQLVKSSKMYPGTENLEFELEPGIYFVSIIGEHKSVTKKLIITQ